MTRWSMSIDLETCTACGTCTVACAQENNVNLGVPETAARHLIRWMEVLPAERGEYPETRLDQLPSPCQHCDSPPCTKVCPVYATYRTDEGLVPQIYHQCIGCRYCVNACPYTCKQFNWGDPVWPGQMDRALNPDVSVRTRGVAEKCNFCLHRLQKARDYAASEERPLEAGDYETACQRACPTKAIHFGDLDDPKSDVALARKQSRALLLLEDLGTAPKVTYLKEKA